jgi:hypothetical protein
MNGAVNPTLSQPSLGVLVVDAIRENASLMVHELMHSQLRFTWKRVETEADYLKQLQELEIAKRLTAGVDRWLHTARPLEACGSGSCL